MQDAWLRTIYGSLSGDRGRRMLHSYQDWLLRRQLAYAAAKSPFYRSKFAQWQIDPRRIRAAADLPCLDFFTTPAELQADPFQFLAVPRQEILYAISSSGTNGEPKIVFLTRNDWDLVVRLVSNALIMLGMTSADVAQILFCFGSPAWMTGSIVQAALERVGTFVLPTGNALPVHKQIAAIRRFGSTALFGTPSYLHRLTVEGAELCDLRSLGVRLIRLGAEPSSDALRAGLRDAWGAEVYDTYGMMELGSAGASECRALAGLHLSPYLLAEVVDPRTGQPLPPGSPGELVFTSLAREGSPLLRYRSGDIGCLLPDQPCACGQVPTDRISRIQGRADDMFFLGSGENVFPIQIEAALTGLEGLYGFQAVIAKEGYRDRVRVRAEAASPSDQLAEAIRRRLYDGLSFLYHDIYQSQTVAPLEIEFVPPGTLHQEAPVKARRVLDLREDRAWPGS